MADERHEYEEMEVLYQHILGDPHTALETHDCDELEQTAHSVAADQVLLRRTIQVLVVTGQVSLDQVMKALHLANDLK